MNKGLSLLGGIGLGAGLMYILDPDRGNRRRALLRDKAVRTAHKTSDAFDTTSRDIANRARGLMAGAKSVFESNDASDDVIVERVRSKMGRVVSHPRAVTVTANNGRVTLSGPILQDEVDALLSCVSAVKGVSEIDNQLEVHKEAGDLPDLQGGSTRPGNRMEFMQRNWSPTARLIAGTAGGAMLVLCAKRRDTLGASMGALGLGLLTRGLTNLETKRLVGIGGGRRAIDIYKSININAPVEEVFKFWTNYENFPQFMSNVREVRDAGNGRSHWVVSGPGGVPVEWDAVITRMEPNKVMAWKSVPGSTVENAGIIQFTPNRDGSTRVQVKLSYNPPAGAVGHAVASLFGSDPKTEMDQDLMRVKTLLETGKAPHDAAAGPQASQKPAAGESAREATTSRR